MNIVTNLAIVFAFVVCSVYGNGTPVKFHNCKSAWEIKEVKVHPCQLQGEMCPLKKGTTPQILVKFVPNTAAKNLTLTVTGIVNGVPVPFPLENSPCVNSGLRCPLTAGQEYEYRLSVPVLDIYPSLQVLIRFNIQSKADSEDETAEKKRDLCFIMKTKIVD